MLLTFALGLYLFFSGFLLNRLEIDVFNNIKISVNGFRNDKVVLIVIDALRFDFLAENTGNQDKHYINKMPFIQKLVKQFPDQALLFKGRADPPTTTLQRLKSIVTGALPTFIDASTNFNSNASLKEDNLISQAVRHGKRIGFMGDDTWQALFGADSFKVCNHPFPSFDVWDLHTVDNGVIEHLFPALNYSNWDILIAHFLGVDHVGHRYVSLN